MILEKSTSCNGISLIYWKHMQVTSIVCWKLVINRWAVCCPPFAQCVQRLSLWPWITIMGLMTYFLYIVHFPIWLNQLCTGWSIMHVMHHAHSEWWVLPIRQNPRLMCPSHKTTSGMVVCPLSYLSCWTVPHRLYAKKQAVEVWPQDKAEFQPWHWSGSFFKFILVIHIILFSSVK